MKELFKDVLGWEGKYQASNTGKIKSLGNEKTRKEKILQPRKWKSYEKIYLSKDGKRFGYQVHRIVWEAFNGPIQEGMEIDHIDGNPSNNRLENLRAVSHQTNMLNPITVERQLAARRNRKRMILSPEQVEERRRIFNKKQREWRRKKRDERFQEMLKKLGLTDEEYLKYKEEDRKERERQERKRYYEKDKKKVYEAKKKWKAAHLEEVREYHRQYWEENKYKYRQKNVSLSAEHAK